MYNNLPYIILVYVVHCSYFIMVIQYGYCLTIDVGGEDKYMVDLVPSRTHAAKPLFINSLCFSMTYHIPFHHYHLHSHLLHYR